METHGRRLVVGGGRGDGMPHAARDDVTVNVDPEALPDILASALRLPCADATFDEVIGQGLPSHVLLGAGGKEISRVLRPGGRLSVRTGAGTPVLDLLDALGDVYSSHALVSHSPFLLESVKRRAGDAGPVELAGEVPAWMSLRAVPGPPFLPLTVEEARLGSNRERVDAWIASRLAGLGSTQAGSPEEALAAVRKGLFSSIHTPGAPATAVLERSVADLMLRERMHSPFFQGTVLLEHARSGSTPAPPTLSPRGARDLTFLEALTGLPADQLIASARAVRKELERRRERNETFETAARGRFIRIPESNLFPVSSGDPLDDALATLRAVERITRSGGSLVSAPSRQPLYTRTRSELALAASRLDAFERGAFPHGMGT